MAVKFSPVSEVLALVGILGKLWHSMSDRITKFHDNPKDFQKLQGKLSSANDKIDICSKTLENCRKAIGAQSIQYELDELNSLEESKKLAQSRFEELARKQQPQRGCLMRFLRAKTTAQDTSKQVQNVQEVIDNADKLDEKIKAIAQENGIFRADYSSTPSLRVPVHLDFNAEGTIEGQLKKKVLESVEHSTHNSQTGLPHVTAAVGVTGMGGVGKTTALIGLANDTEVQEKFSDGIYFVPVGKDATDDKLISSLQGIVDEIRRQECI